MKIGIITAMESELLPLLPLIGGETFESYAMRTFYKGRAGKNEVIAVWGGISKTNAATSAVLLKERYAVDAIIFCGVAGGMDKKVDIGDVLVLTESVSHDMTEMAICADQLPHLKSLIIPHDEKLIACAHEAAEGFGAQVFFGRGATGEQFIEDDGRPAINERFAPLCVDMETASSAQACYMMGVPFICVRAVSDSDRQRGFDVFMKNLAFTTALAARFTVRLTEKIK